MTHLQEIRDKISRLERRYSVLQYQKDVLERAWSDTAKAALPGFKKHMDVVLTELREAEAEEHRLTWPRRK